MTTNGQHSSSSERSNDGALAKGRRAARPSRVRRPYEAIIADIKNLSSPPTITSDLNAVLDAFFAASLGIVSTRAVLTTFVKVLRDLKNDDLWIAVGTHTLSQLSAQPSSFLDQAAAVRELVAEAHENNEDFLDAAKSLAEIPLDGSQRKVTNDDKARVWDRDLDLHFKLSQARILDSKRDFLGASNRYHEISLSPAIAEEERLHTLSMAVKCAILAPAGPMRSRALGKLYKDERSAGLDEFGMLEKMFFDRLLAPAEVEKFAQGLQPHQLATTAAGATVRAKAVVEHNLLGASRLYRNIGFEALGSLLGLDGEKAEETTARMIEQGRLLGRIDQLEEVIWFEGGEASGQKGSGRAEVTVGKEMRQWDANVQSMAEEVENVTNALQKQFPEFVEANLVV
uniref:COP9 signalosome complex subunit 4 n=1 Tax=Colletotrichum fructicola (strain Nara gc5) TaxID=1213859 RepID=L2FBX8_COLFN